MATEPKQTETAEQATKTESGQAKENTGRANDAPQAKGGIMERIQGAISKGQAKLNEATEKMSVKLDETAKKIDAKTNEVVKKYEKEVEKLNDQTKEIAEKEMPNSMAKLLLQATNSLDSQLKVIQQQLTNLKQHKIVLDFQRLSQAKALIFVSQLSVKLLASGGYGRGIVVTKLKDGSWSQPCAIETVEVGAGWQIGVSRTRFVIPLYNDSQIDALLSDKGHQVSLSGSMQFAFGKDGRLMKGMISGSDQSLKKQNANDKVAANATIADMQGFEIGVGAAVSVIQPLKDVNNSFYYDANKELLSMSNILNGTIKCPAVIEENEESKLSDQDKARNKQVDDAIVQYTVLVSMLTEGMKFNVNDNVDGVKENDVSHLSIDDVNPPAKDNDDTKTDEGVSTTNTDNQ